jgi:cytochrome c oxidase assembly protein subunit 15
MTNSNTGLIRLVKFALLLTLTVIALGAYTRLSDAGLGCPDWPGCYGHFTVPQSSQALEKAELLYPHLDVEPHKAWPEMIHRYFAGTLGLVVFLITFLCIKTRPVAITLPLMIAAVVIFQALLGMWTVTMMLLPIVVMGHLLGGFTLLASLWLLLWQLQRTSAPQNSEFTSTSALAFSSNLKLGAVLTMAVVVGQIMLGGWTSSNYAALMCSSLPICEGNWLSYLDFKTAFTLIHHGHDSYEFGVLEYGPRLTIHVSHRFGAILTILVVSALAFRLWKVGLLSLSKMLLGALLVQVVLGVSNVVFNLPLTIAVMHNLGAALLMIAVLKCNYQLWSSLPVSQAIIDAKANSKVTTRSVSHE